MAGTLTYPKSFEARLRRALVDLIESSLLRGIYSPDIDPISSTTSAPLGYGDVAWNLRFELMNQDRSVPLAKVRPQFNVWGWATAGTRMDEVEERTLEFRDQLHILLQKQSSHSALNAVWIKRINDTTQTLRGKFIAVMYYEIEALARQGEY